MDRRLQGSIATALAFAACAGAAPSSTADGLPVAGVSAGRAGVAPAEGKVRYVAVKAGQGTFAARISQSKGTVLDSAFLRGRFTIPAVAYDATAAGLSDDGRTLVLIRPRERFPQASTRFAVLDTKTLRVREVTTLRGDFSFDALSPDGRTLYLIEYPSRNLQRYRVRAFDLQRGRLAPEPIVDPSEPDERMAGTPITRAMSPDGRWAYTLYEGAGGHEPFIHALDTSAGTAACIDLPQLEGRPGYRLGLEVAPAGGMLTVLFKNEPVLAVDPEGFDVSEIASADTGAAAPSPQAGGGFRWALAAVGLAGGLAAAAALRRRRPRPPVSEAELAELVGLEPEAQGESEREEEKALA